MSDQRRPPDDASDGEQAQPGDWGLWCGDKTPHKPHRWNNAPETFGTQMTWCAGADDDVSAGEMVEDPTPDNPPCDVHDWELLDTNDGHRCTVCGKVSKLKTNAADYPTPDLSTEVMNEVRVRVVAEIARQRELGWPDFHPETFCHRCGLRNVRSWSVASGLWNEALGDEGGIVCPQCFTELWEQVTGREVTWVLSIDGATDTATTERVTALTPNQAYFARRQVARWLKVKFDFEQITEYKDGEPQKGTWPQLFGPRIRQLEPDADHSGLLYHLLTGGEPLPEPPPLQSAYPVYPPADSNSGDGS